MSTDIVRIALAYFTDWAKFEQLATEIMRDEGYPDIKPLGGQKDGGKDAVVERFYSHEGRRTRTVFQFSLRKDILEKIKETIGRLNDSGAEYEKLVFVTTTSFGAERQEEAKKLVRKDYDLSLEIYENRTLMTYLSNFENGMFYRVFPDVRRQVEALLASEGERRRDDAQAREREFLKVCCAFSFDPAARKTRKSLIDQTVLALISMEGGIPLSAGKVLARATEILGPGVLADESQVMAAIGRLISGGRLESNREGFYVSTGGQLSIESAQAAMEANSEASIGDIIADVVQALGESISDAERLQLAENARTVLVEYFRLNGLELANSILSGVAPVLVYGGATERLKEMASCRLRPHLGNLLFDAIGSAIANPTEEQARYFANCSRAYLAVQVMNIDPALREFQASRIANKTFVLDTDFVIDAIIQDLPKSSIYRNLVNQLLSLGAKVLVPEEVLHEVTTHFMISVRTYDYFADYLNSLTEELLTAQVQNALVRGYWYYAHGRGCYRNGFMKYRQNYYDEGSKEAFVAEVAREALPGVNIGSIADVLGVDVDQSKVEPVRSVMLELSRASVRIAHRTEEQIAELSNIDTLLMLATAKYNESSSTDSKTVLGHKGYIITTSGRYIRAAERLNLDIRVSTRPQILIGLMEMFSPGGIDDRHFVALFENPIIQQSIDKCWSGIEVLLSAGIELRGVSLTRLKHDVETRLHTHISNIREAEEDDDAKVDGQIELVQVAEKQGYQPNTVVATLMAKGTAVEDELKKLAEENEVLREAVKSFGRKKERWLRRLDRIRKK
jgi:hypothetical protein